MTLLTYQDAGVDVAVQDRFTVQAFSDLSLTTYLQTVTIESNDRVFNAPTTFTTTANPKGVVAGDLDADQTPKSTT